MPRSLLSLCLFLFASAAMAGSQSANEDGGASGAKPDKPAVASTAPDDAAAVETHPATPPAHRGTTHAVTPRWHSLLPGMIH